MKHWLLVTLTLTLICPKESTAQLLKHYGLKVAVTSADQKYDVKYVSEVKTKRRTGFNVAAFLEWFDVPYFSFLTQVEYAQRGMGQDFVLTGPSGPEPIGVKTSYSRLDYLSIPIMGKIRLQTETITPFVSVGPRVDFFLGYHSDENLFNPVFEKFKTTVLGGSFGIGVQTETLLPVIILAELRYNIDLADSYSTDALQVRNNAFDVWLGIAF